MGRPILFTCVNYVSRRREARSNPLLLSHSLKGCWVVLDIRSIPADSFLWAETWRETTFPSFTGGGSIEKWLARGFGEGEYIYIVKGGKT